MTGLSKDLAGDPLRRASAVVRGFQYQFWRTVEAWIDLGPEEVLFVEGAEDFDRIRPGEGTAVQVKDDKASGPLTLSSQKALGALTNFWNLVKRNRGRKVWFKFITTSEVGAERDAFGERKGVEIWNLCARSPLESCSNDLGAIREFLLKKEVLDAGLLAFLEAGPLDAMLEELIRPFEWLYDQPALEDVREVIVGRLLELERPRGLTVTDARRLAHQLQAIVVDAALSKAREPLTYIALIEKLDKATNVEMPREALRRRGVSSDAINRLIFKSLGEGQDELPALTEVPDEFAAPVLRSRAWHRTKLAQRVQEGLAGGLAFVDGGTGMGKTTLVRQVVEGRGPLLWAALRDKTVREVVETCRNLIRRVAIAPPQPTVVLDDLNADGDPRSLEEPLRKLSIAVRARRGALAIVSYKTAGPRLASVLGLSGPAAVRLPLFEEDEIAQLLITEGCAAKRAPALARVIRLQTGGHPQLVAAWIDALKAASFPKPTVEEIFDQPKEIRDARAEALHVIRSVLPQGARDLLYRLSFAIPPLKRSHALRVSEGDPPILRAGEMFDSLIGPWLEEPLSDRYRVSALASRAGHDQLPPDEANRVHAQIATALLAERTLSVSEFSGAIAHALSGGAEPQLSIAIRVFLTAPRELKQRLANDLAWVAGIGTERGTDLRVSNTTVRRLFRLLQWDVAGLVAPDYLDSLSVVMQAEFAGAIDDPEDARLRIVYLSKQLLEISRPLSPEQIVRHTLELWHLAERADVQAVRTTEVLPPMYPGFERPMFADLFAAVLIPRIREVEDLRKLISAIDALAEPDRSRLLDGFKTDDGELRLLFNGPWVSMKRSESRGFEDYAVALEQALSAGRRWQHRPWLRASARTLSAILDEMLDRPEEARRVVAAIVQEAGASANLDDQLAVIAFNRKDYRAALEAWQRILPSWNADRLVYDLQPVFSLRCAAIAAAKLEKWDVAARLFAEANVRSADVGMRPWKVGLLGDRGYALWRSGDRRGAVAALTEAVEALEKLPNRPESFAEYAVQKLVGHTLAWLASPEGHATPVPGMCSNLDPDERIKQLPPAPTVQAWFLVYELACHAGDDESAVAAVNKFRHAPFAFLRAVAARDALERRLKSGSLDEILPLATTTAVEMAKSAQRNNVPVQEPDPPRLTAQLTDGLVAAYIRPALWSAIMLTKVLGRSIIELVAAWRDEINPPESHVLDELHLCDGQARMAVSELATILQDNRQQGEKRVLAAVLLLGREDTSPQDALYAQAALIDAAKDYEILRETAAEAFNDLVCKDWRRFCDNPFMLRSPRFYVEAIRLACESRGGGWPAAARIILSALPTTSLTIPKSMRARLEEMARSS
jgi:hypothetical protein